jgi:uncharacterized coiled-coil protein SlyX
LAIWIFAGSAQLGDAMTNDTAKNTDRLTIMEEKLEFQDYTMEKLNEVIITQQRQLDKLEGEMLSLRKKFDVVYAETDDNEKSTPQEY